MMAIFVGIVTPPIIISGALGLSVEQSSFVISMALFASGISTLIKVGITDIAGGQYVKDNIPEAFATLQNLGLAAIVLVTIIVLNRSQKKFVRMSAIFIGLVAGYIVAAGVRIIASSTINRRGVLI